jgi:hypothetical protein
MKNIHNPNLVEMNENEMKRTIGGGFAYDAGFFFRELAIGFVRGPYFAGGAIGSDLGVNYRPVR